MTEWRPDGLTVERILAMGDAAEVLLCTQHSPRRPVVATVWRDAAANRAARSRLTARAAQLVALSAHPAIATIHDAGVGADGRPYLVTEYCPGETLASPSRIGAMSEPEVLRTVIRLAGAVETAHRSGLVHGAITSARVLTTSYGWPALGGWDLPAMPDADEVDDARHADVRALASLARDALAGPAGAATTGVLAVRADALDALLRETLSPGPGSAVLTAADVGRALQRIEEERNLPVTHLDVRVPAPASDEDAEATLLSDRAALDERTRAARHAPGGHPAEEQVADDATILADRHTDRHAGRPVGRPVADAAPEDATIVVARAGDTGPVLRPRETRAADRPADRRAAFDPATAPREVYGIRRAAPAAAVSRNPLVAPAPPAGAPPRRRAEPARRRTGTIVVAAVAGIGVLGAAAAGIVLLWNG